MYLKYPTQNGPVLLKLDWAVLYVATCCEISKVRPREDSLDELGGCNPKWEGNHRASISGQRDSPKTYPDAAYEALQTSHKWPACFKRISFITLSSFV